jgi:predicted transposase YbfD/YdcC
VAFQKGFSAWITALMARNGLTPITAAPHELAPIAIDGKAQRGSARRTVGRSALHAVSAWSVENHLTLGQVATGAKSNEITAIPELLELLDLNGAVVTIDAMGCQKEIAADIVGRGGHYVLAAKENQPHLYEDITRAFDKALDQGEPGVDFTECQTEEVRNGRQETRTCCVITHPEGIRNAGLWLGLTAIVMVISHRVVDGVASIEIRYFIGSTAATAEQYLRWIRGHWGIENSLHWVLDVCFREDDQRHWAGNSAMNLGWLRKLAGVLSIVVDGDFQAAGFSLIPSMYLVPRTTSASSGEPFNDRQPFDALSISLKTIVRHAVLVPLPFVLSCLSRTVENTLSIGLVVRM